MKKSIALLICMMPVIANAQGQPSLVWVVFNPTTVTGGTSSTATITISAPARNNGLDVTLSLNSTVARVTSSTITIAEGQSSQTVSVTTSPVATQQVVILSASTRDGTRSGAITISPPSISAIAITPSSVKSGDQATATITLTGNAPPDGFPVSLSSNNAAIRAPASVNVASNQRTANVTMIAGTVSAQTSVTLTAGEGGSSKTTTLTIAPVPVTITAFEYPTDPVSGAGVYRTITLSGPAPSGGTIVQLSYGASNILRVNSTSINDTIPAGQRSIRKSNVVPLTITDRPFEITATLDGISTRRSGTLRAPTIVSLSIADSIFEGTTATLRGVLNGTAPSGEIPVVITSNNEYAITSPGGVSAGYEFGSMVYTIRPNDVKRPTPVTLSVEREGVVRSVSTIIIPRIPVLTGFTISPSSVQGGQSVTLKVTIDVPAPPNGIVIQLAQVLGLRGFDVPTTLLIPEGATSKAVAVATPNIAMVPIWTEVKASRGHRTLAARVTINP